MERWEVHPKVFDPEHVYNQGSRVLQLAACFVEWQHHKSRKWNLDKDNLVQIQLSHDCADDQGGEEKDRFRYQEVLQERVNPGWKDIDRLPEQGERVAKNQVLYWHQTDWGTVRLHKKKLIRKVRKLP